jgi:hypothetical protein
MDNKNDSLYLNKPNYRWIYLIFFLKFPTILKIDSNIMEIVLLKRDLRLIYMILRILLILFWCINFSSCVFYGIGYEYM